MAQPNKGGSQAGVKVCILATGLFSEHDASHNCNIKRCTRSLYELNGLPVLSYWLTLIKQCPRLLPIQQNVFVVCSARNEDELRDWASNTEKSAGGFPQDNICSNGASTSRGEAGDLLHWIESYGIASDLLVVSGDAIFSPQFNLSRIVEHSLIRARDTVTFVNDAEPLTLPSEWPRLRLESGDFGAPNPRVAAFDDDSSSAVPPLLFLRRTSVAHLRSFQAECAQMSSLGQFLEYLIRKEPIYALETVGLCSVNTPEQAEYADNFFAMYARELRMQRENIKNVKHTESHVQLKLEAASASGQPIASQSVKRSGPTAEDLKRMGDNGPLPLLELMRTFQERYASAQQEARERERREPKLPPRFEDASVFKWSAKQEHPVFTTSSNAYGKKGPTQHEMPLKWSGVNGEFTTTQFAGGPNKSASTCFNTSVTKSKVHRLMDDF